jgi:hypothetical protein
MFAEAFKVASLAFAVDLAAACVIFPAASVATAVVCNPTLLTVPTVFNPAIVILAPTSIPQRFSFRTLKTKSILYLQIKSRVQFQPVR